MGALPEDKVVRVLSFFIIFFTFVVLGIVWFRPDDGQTFTAFLSLVSGFAAALLMRFQADRPIPPPGSHTVTTSSKQETTETPKEPLPSGPANPA